jgi:hypothetical protein
VAPTQPGFRLAAAVVLLAVASVFTWRTIDGLSSRRTLRTELAEISHVRYGLLSADRWVEKIVPVLDAKIDTLDLKDANQANLRLTVENALYRLLDDIKDKMGANNAPGNALMANLMVGALRPHVPEYTDVVLAELGKPETRDAFRKYIKDVLAQGAKNTFGNVDLRWYSSILTRHGCADAGACRLELGNRIREADTRIAYHCLAVLLSSAALFVLLMTGRRVLPRSSAVVLLLACVVLLLGGVLTPMIEVEAKISQLRMTFLGEPIAFADQVLYFQSKSVLEVFHVLITQGRPDMWIVGALVLLFSIIFPTLKIFTSAFCLFKPVLLRESRVARFLVLESSKWSMADVMALAIFMAFVAFNGLIANTMGGLKETGAQLTIPTDSSKLLPGYYLFIGFCISSLFLAKKLQRSIRTLPDAEPAGQSLPETP